MTKVCPPCTLQMTFSFSTEWTKPNSHFEKMKVIGFLQEVNSGGFGNLLPKSLVYLVLLKVIEIVNQYMFSTLTNNNAKYKKCLQFSHFFAYTSTWEKYVIAWKMAPWAVSVYNTNCRTAVQWRTILYRRYTSNLSILRGVFPLSINLNGYEV